VRGADHDREAAGGGLHEDLGDAAPLSLRQLVRLAHDPEDVQTVYTAPRLELDQRRNAGLVHLARDVERRRGDGDDAPELRGHAAPLPSETAL